MPKTTKKPKREKKLAFMTVEVPKAPTPTAIENVVVALDSLEASTGWGIVRKILDENIKYLELCILNKFDPVEKTPLTDAEVEICRYKRTLNIELRDTPKNYRQKISDDGDVPKNFDPYFMSKAELDMANKKENEG